MQCFNTIIGDIKTVGTILLIKIEFMKSTIIGYIKTVGTLLLIQKEFMKFTMLRVILMFCCT